MNIGLTIYITSIIELDDGKIETGNPDQFDGKNPLVSCRFSLQNQSIEPLVSYHLLTIYTIYTMVDFIYTTVINTSNYTSIYGSTVQFSVAAVAARCPAAASALPASAAPCWPSKRRRRLCRKSPAMVDGN